MAKMQICKIEGCARTGKKHRKTGRYYLLKGMCNMHYQRVIYDSRYPLNNNRMKHPLYSRYRNMMNRCYNAKSPRYKDWGGRGIKVCNEWKDLMTGFEKFVLYMESLPDAYKDDYSMDRKNNDGNYEPGNLRWASRSTQNKNRRAMKRRSH